MSALGAPRSATLTATACLDPLSERMVVGGLPSLPAGGAPPDSVELLLTALATSGVLVTQQAASEMGVALHAARAVAECDLTVGPGREARRRRVRAFRLSLELSGPSPDEAAMLSDVLRHRCPVCRTLERTTPVDIVVDLPA